jgi:hypothetical protein
MFLGPANQISIDATIASSLKQTMQSSAYELNSGLEKGAPTGWNLLCACDNIEQDNVKEDFDGY